MEVKDWTAAGKERFTTPGGPPRSPAEEARRFAFAREPDGAAPSPLQPEPRAEISPFSREAGPAPIPEPEPQAAPADSEVSFWKKSLRWLLPLLAGAFLAGLLLGSLLYPLLYEKGDAADTTAPETTAAGSGNETGPHPTDPRNGDTTEGALADRIYRENAVAVVGVTASYRTDPLSSSVQMPQSRTGVLITEDGYLLTDADFLQGASRITVSLRDGRQFEARVLNKAETVQSGLLALLKIDAEALPCAAQGDADRLLTGSRVYLLSSPEAASEDFAAGTFTGMSDVNIGLFGSTEVLSRQMDTDLSLEDRVGAPLFDEQGQLVGMVSSFAFHIPVDEADPGAGTVIVEDDPDAEDSASFTISSSSSSFQVLIARPDQNQVLPLTAELWSRYLLLIDLDRGFEAIAIE